ncbi:DinB family protein [Jeotgalibacillus sp. ET6]|uniref:DinB family protein n=1 Tax=Jeotgalibacillus sp. ET6 TaxID=3037260 RepID=UPI0024184B84|nr:DinB family protein [Jeotgalibacillus sp. ET6]MDG5472121.1 DinB family protein [Jeotgalibacillus sp. ET6]
MRKLFEYNWQVREEWFDWCETVPEEELLKERTGGIGSILYTLFHIVETEYSWLQELEGNPGVEEPPFEEYSSLEKVRRLSNEFHKHVEPFVREWTADMETLRLRVPDEEDEGFTYGEVMRHVIAHEIHHIGQLSIWSRELERKPVSANLIGRGLFGK